MNPMTFRILPIAALMGMIQGCTLTPPSTDHSIPYNSQWNASISHMGVSAIVPPSEDVRVGDLFVYPFNPNTSDLATYRRSQSGPLAISPRWASLSLLKDLEAEYQLRPAWPKTPEAYLQIAEDPESREWPEPATDERTSLFVEDSVTDRLRIIGIPEFSNVHLTEGELNGLIPTEAINLVFGAAWNDRKAVTLRLNTAETYSLGLQKIIEAAIEDLPPVEDQAASRALKEPYRNHLSLVADPTSETVWVRILSDVIYIRSMDIIIQAKASFKEDDPVNASEFVEETEMVIESPDSDLDEGEPDDLPEPDPEPEMEEVLELIPDHALDPAYAAFVRAQAINRILIESDNDDLPGGFIRLISVTDDSVTLRRIWQRGLAIGARGLTLEVDKATGEIIRSDAMSRVVNTSPAR